LSRVALVTGAGRGIGAAVAVRLARAGFQVIGVARSRDQLDAVAASTGLVPHVCDLEDAAAVEAMCAEVLSRFGRVDVLVNNAGIVVRHPVDGHPVDAWDRVQAVNLRAPFQLARACLPAMRAARAGRIINVSSISGTLGTPGLSAYCASKWGLIGFTKALAEEVKREGVVVTAVCPGSVDTEMLKGSGYAPDMTPDDVAAVVEFLVHAPAAVAGCALEIFG